MTIQRLLGPVIVLTLNYFPMTEKKNPSPMKDFTDKLFDLCKKSQEEIPPQKLAEVLRDYADRLDG